MTMKFKQNLNVEQNWKKMYQIYGWKKQTVFLKVLLINKTILFIIVSIAPRWDYSFK